jgi:predicted CxxxxCH...CXXCH cytochrome family protein
MAVTWGQAMDCNMCHYWAAAPTDTDNTGPGSLSAGHNTHFKAGKSCTNCHPNNTDTTHVSRLPVQSYNANIVKAGMSYNLPAKTCTNTGTGCHNNPTLPTPVWGTTGNGCMTCHNYPDGANWSSGNGHAVQHPAAGGNNTHLLDVASYSRTLDTYSSVVNNTGKCGKCHKGLKTNHNNGTTNLNSAGVGYGYCSADFTITVNAPGDVKCSNVKCHSGKITPNWW